MKGKANYRMVGAWVPLPIAEYLSWYCLVHSKGKTSIFRLLIVGWYVKEKEKTSIELLKNEIRKRVQEEWNGRKTYLSVEKTDFTEDFKTFLDKKVNELGKFIDHSDLKKVIEGITL